MRRFLKVPAVSAISLLLLTGSPAFATQTAHHDTHRIFSEQKAGVYRHPAFDTCGTAESCAPRSSGGNTTHGDWPANMILD
jgi:hypothetical protein